MRYAKIERCSYNNGIGTRVILWVVGCTFKCKGCHNSEIFDFNCGKLFTEKSKKELFDYLSDPYITGLSILGGEPLDNTQSNNREVIYNLCNEIKDKFKDKDIWLWTGYNIQSLPTLPNVDILIDGKFEVDNPTTKKWRGSDNQHLYKIENNNYVLVD